MKDFYDLWIIARSFEFSAETLGGAIAATFTRRKTAIPSDVPAGLSPAFADDPAKQGQWAAFLARTDLSAPELPVVAELLRAFLVPPLQALSRGNRR
jgi:hypothetical protein